MRHAQSLLMAGITTRKVLGDEITGLRITLPSAWTKAWNLRAGDRLEVLYDDVLLAIPKAGPQAERMRRAMAEVRR
jgi:bifunctional DNA-binding transcriptional regulator/antitoxin component of YhaV-PrlF toxin-antitoxin module